MNIMIQEIGEIKYKDVKTYELWSYSEQLNSGVWSELDPRREDPVFSMFLGLNDRGGSQKVREDVWERITLWSGSENGWVRLGGTERMGENGWRCSPSGFKQCIHIRPMLYGPQCSVYMVHSFSRDSSLAVSAFQTRHVCADKVLFLQFPSVWHPH